MDIQRIILRVSDLGESLEFWTGKLGLELSGRGGPFAFIDGGGVQLVLNEAGDVSADGSLTEIVFEVEDVRSAYDQLAGRGVPFEVELRPVTSEGGKELWSSHFRDPDGHLASITGWV